MIRLYLALLIIGTTWGFTIPLTRISVSTGYHPFGLIFWQQVVMVVLLTVLAHWRKLPFPSLAKNPVLLVGIALLGTIIPNSFSYWAAAHLPAGIMSIVIAIVPMFALPVAMSMGFERFELRRMTGIALGAVAMVLIAGPETSLHEGTEMFFLLIALIAPFCYGLEGNFVLWRGAGGLHPIQMLWGASVIALVLSGALMLGTGTQLEVNGLTVVELAIAGSAVFHVIAYTGYLWLVGQAGSVFASQVAYLVTSSGVLLSMILLGERYGLFVWIALALVLLGITLVQPRQTSEVSTPSE